MVKGILLQRLPRQISKEPVGLQQFEGQLGKPVAEWGFHEWKIAALALATQIPAEFKKHEKAQERSSQEWSCRAWEKAARALEEQLRRGPVFSHCGGSRYMAP
jgi:hypothetical protein